MKGKCQLGGNGSESGKTSLIVEELMQLMNFDRSIYLIIDPMVSDPSK